MKLRNRFRRKKTAKSIQTCGKQRTFFLISGSLKIFKRKEKNILRQMKKKSTTVLNFSGWRKNNSKREVYSKGVCQEPRKICLALQVIQK